ncbi:DNA polymerase II, partial [Candidatus Woesearchaeota archaeon]|nr:DNA polymerase II [Candidatus Woesearchaeota archaeon]
RLRIESSFLKESTADFPGRQVLDGIQMLKLNFISLDNYKLATAAHELLGDKKLIEEDDGGKSITEAYENDLQKLVDYNLKDSVLVLDILKKTNAVDIMVNRTLLTGMSLERVRGSIASFDSLYLRGLRAKGVVGPTGGFADKEEQITGGFVKDSKPGIYDYVVVCDFKSLYPSVMRTFNIDPLAFEMGKLAEDADNKDKWIKAPNGAIFSADDAILPDLLQKLWAARDKAKKEGDEFASFAIKILMNSFFGVLAAPACRFFSMELGNAITTSARMVIQGTIEKLEEKGLEVIYGDTDSVFIDVKSKTYEDAQKTAEEISKEINDYFDSFIKKEHHRSSFIELEPDKIFIRFIMPKVRGKETGAKKRYAGLVKKGDGTELSITGLETVRRDWTDLAKTFQMKILELVFAKEDPSQYIKQFVKYLQDGKLDHELVYVKAIRKDLASYVKTTPPHVKAARILEEHGRKLDSNLMEYVMTTEGPYPLSMLNEKGAPAIDYEHYEEKQLKPIADAVLVFFNTKFDDVLKGSSQSTLGQF